MQAAGLPEVSSPSSQPADGRHVVIEPARGWQGLGTAEIWRYRELVWALSLRDIRVRYKQTVLGFLWAVLQPFIYMVVFTILLHRVGGVQGDAHVPYAIFSYAGLLIWNYFSDALNRSAGSLVTNNVLVSKVYFPRLTAPLSGVLSPLLDFAIGCVLLLAIMWYYSFSITLDFALIPVFLLLGVVAASAFGVWFAALNVKYRDINYAMTFIVQIWLFVSPVLYTAKKVTGTWRIIYSLNPMGGIVLGFRHSVLSSGPLDWNMIGIGSIVSVVVLVSGVLYFRRVERTFADAI